MKRLILMAVMFTIAFVAMRVFMDAPGWGAAIGGWIMAGWVKEDSK